MGIYWEPVWLCRHCDAFILKWSVDGSLCSAIKTTTASHGGDYQVLVFIYTQTAAAGGNAQITSCVPDNYFHEKLTVGLFCTPDWQCEGESQLTDSNSTNSVTTKAAMSQLKVRLLRVDRKTTTMARHQDSTMLPSLCHMLNIWIR